jgi:hypothetical protein
MIWNKNVLETNGMSLVSYFKLGELAWFIKKLREPCLCGASFSLFLFIESMV